MGAIDTGMKWAEAQACEMLEPILRACVAGVLLVDPERVRVTVSVIEGASSSAIRYGVWLDGNDLDAEQMTKVTALLREIGTGNVMALPPGAPS